MKYAEEIWTINSTVGLEALIMGKKIKILGKALYKDFKGDYLKKYISSYLLNIDFFDKKDISMEATKNIINRLEDN